MDAEQILKRPETVWKSISERFERTFAEKPRGLLANIQRQAEEKHE